MSNEITIYKYLDQSGLSILWDKIKTNFATKGELTSAQNEIDGDIADINSDLSEVNNSISGLQSDLNDLRDSISETITQSVDDITLKLNDDNKLSAAIGLDINTESQEIRLIAKGNSVTNDNKVLSTISYSAFVKDGILDNVEMVIIEEGDENKEPGTYLKFTFNTDAGKNAIYVNVTDMIDVYVGEGYIIVENSKITLDYAKLLTDLTNDLSKTFLSISDFNTAKTELNDLISKNSNNINQLLGRLTPVETKITELDSAVADNIANIDLLKQKDTEIESNIEELGSAVSSLNQLIANNKQLVEELAIRMVDKADKVDLDNLAIRVGKNEGDINNLTSRIDNLEKATTPDGELITISINQVIDFKPLNESDIEDICKGSDNENQIINL